MNEYIICEFIYYSIIVFRMVVVIVSKTASHGGIVQLSIRLFKKMTRTTPRRRRGKMA